MNNAKEHNKVKETIGFDPFVNSLYGSMATRNALYSVKDEKNKVTITFGSKKEAEKYSNLLK